MAARMTYKRSLAAVTLALLLAGCDTASSDPLGEAQSAFAEQDYFAARDKAQAALRDDGGNLQALDVLARAQIAMGQGGDALATLSRLESAPQLPEDFMLLKAEAHLQEGETDKALAAIEGDESADGWRLRALVAAMEDKPEEAGEAFVQGRAAPGDKLRLFAAEASWRLSRGEADAARDPVKRAQELGPERIETLYITARLAQLDEDSELAARAFMGILEITPLDRPAMLGAIAELGNMGRIDLLEPLVKRGVEAYPNDAEFIYLSARVKAEEGDWDGVREVLQARENMLGEHPDSRGLYAEALFQLGQVEQARAHLAPLYRREPGNAKVARTYTKVLLATGDAARAREVIAPFAASPDAIDEDRELAARAARG